MKKWGKMLLALPVWLPLMFVGCIAYTLDEICDDLLTGIGEWIQK
jgi:hypothetical protein